MARIDTHVEAWLAERRALGLTAAGEAAFRSTWQAFRTVPGSYRPTQETVRLFGRAQAAVDADGADRSLRRLLRLLTVLVERGAIPPFPLPSRPSPRRVDGRAPMMEAEVQSLILAIPDLGIRTLAGLVYFTGLRAARLISLTPREVDPHGLRLFVSRSRYESYVPLGTDAADVVEEWTRRRRAACATFLHDDHGAPLALREASTALRQAGAQVNRPAVGFGHLQYAHLPLLAAAAPMLTRDLLETRLQQPFRLRYVRVPHLLDRRADPDLSQARITPMEHIFNGLDRQS